MQTSVLVKTQAPSDPIMIRLDLFNRGVGLFISIPVGVTATYTVQYTGDPPGTTPVNWITSDMANLVNATTSQLAFLTMPVTFVRVNVTAFAGQGNINFTVVQADAYGSN